MKIHIPKTDISLSIIPAGFFPYDMHIHTFSFSVDTAPGGLGTKGDIVILYHFKENE